jgi:hypothetical protein
MLDAAELRLLTRWCQDQEMRWQPLRVDADGAMLVLEPAVARHPWQRMVLTADEAGLRLEDELGDALAAASDLPALLDALDGGLAEPAAARVEAPALFEALM